MAKSTASCQYDVIPLTAAAGAEIRGINLVHLQEECADLIKQEAFMHRFLVFRGQSLPWNEQIRVTSLFGTIVDDANNPHRAKFDKTPDPRIVYFSNDESLGLRGNGIEGWHCDGNTVEVPHTFTFIYCVQPNKNGPTLVVPLREIVEMLSDEEKKYLETAYFVSGSNASIIHPLLYKHPQRNDDTIMLALGTLSGQYLQDDGNGNMKTLTKDETQFIMDLLEAKILGSNLIYAMNYKAGDLLIVNNYAVAHIAGPGSQLSPEVSGTRIIHRSTTFGESKPSKESKVDYKCANFPPFEEGYCLFSLKGSVYYPRVGYFDSQPVARKRCKDFNRYADLAVILNEDWNDLVKPIMTATGNPHWTNGSNPQNADIYWTDTLATFSNWDPEQPNDHGGYEDCLILGPFAKWYDIPCSGPKFHDPENMAPVVVWEDGVRKMRNIYPLCGVPISKL